MFFDAALTPHHPFFLDREPGALSPAWHPTRCSSHRTTRTRKNRCVPLMTARVHIQLVFHLKPKFWGDRYWKKRSTLFTSRACAGPPLIDDEQWCEADDASIDSGPSRALTITQILAVASRRPGQAHLRQWPVERLLQLSAPLPSCRSVVSSGAAVSPCLRLLLSPDLHMMEKLASLTHCPAHTDVS